MQNLLDLYVLGERSRANVNRFLEEFVKNADERTGEYWFPMHSQTPEFTTDSLKLILATLLERPNEPFSIYWGPGDLKSAGVYAVMLFFTDDNHMIAGLSVYETAEAHFCDRLMSVMGSRLYGVTVEQPPPLNREEFIKDFGLQHS